MRFLFATLLTFMLAASPQAGAQATRLEIQRNGAAPSQKGPPETFTGAVRIDTPFRGRGQARASGSVVTFEPGAHTAWHTHPLGQTLIVTNGCGLVQAEGGPAQVIRPGDVVWTPAGVRHWHGATPTTPMSHVAIVESVDEKRADWMEHVAAEHYAAAARSAPCA